jgi:alpha-tubulin suppressor-like RCC1 family protein
VTTSGKVYTWGNGENGMLGHGNKTSVSTPKMIESMSHLFATSISCGAFHTAVIAAESAEAPSTYLPYPTGKYVVKSAVI